jgi:HEPN domain-containing protein
LKGTWIEAASEDGFPPRIHSLQDLAAEIGLSLSDEQMRFLERLSARYLPTRYPGMDVEDSDWPVQEYYDKTAEMYAWLRQQLMSNGPS